MTWTGIPVKINLQILKFTAYKIKHSTKNFFSGYDVFAFFTGQIPLDSFALVKDVIKAKLSFLCRYFLHSN